MHKLVHVSSFVSLHRVDNMSGQLVSKAIKWYNESAATEYCSEYVIDELL